MELILDNELEIKVFLYDTEKERDESIAMMEGLGFMVKKSGLANISPESTVTAYSDDNNWRPFAEFAKIREKLRIREPMSFETGLYFFNIYNPIEK